jgi:hypothetical protein
MCHSGPEFYEAPCDWLGLLDRACPRKRRIFYDLWIPGYVAPCNWPPSAEPFLNP